MFSSFAFFSPTAYALRMGTPEADQALTDSKRIERLEVAVSRLSAALGMLVSQLQDQGFEFPGEIGNSLALEAADDRGAHTLEHRERSGLVPPARSSARSLAG